LLHNVIGFVDQVVRRVTQVKSKLIAALSLGAALSASCAFSSNLPDDRLAELGRQPKFLPYPCYTGVDTPEDLGPLTGAVDSTVRDIASLRKPRDPAQVRRRLNQLIQEVDLFATEDRDEAYRYAVRIWRASGMKGESGLFPKRDAEVLLPMPGC
jgi:hypothetical protein